MSAEYRGIRSRAIAIPSACSCHSSRNSAKPVSTSSKIDDLSVNIVSAFLLHLEQNRSCSTATRNQRLAAIHAFAKYTGQCSPEHGEWCAQMRIVPFKRAWNTPVTYMEKDEMDELLRSPNRTTDRGRRDYALLLFLYNSGARASEAARVAIEDLTWDSTGTGSVKIQGKGRKIRFCPLWKTTMSELRLPSEAGCRQATVHQSIGEGITRFGIHASRRTPC